MVATLGYLGICCILSIMTHHRQWYKIIFQFLCTWKSRTLGQHWLVLYRHIASKGLDMSRALTPA